MTEERENRGGQDAQVLQQNDKDAPHGLHGMTSTGTTRRSMATSLEVPQTLFVSTGEPCSRLARKRPLLGKVQVSVATPGQLLTTPKASL